MSKDVSFAKMSGAGNDFVVIDAETAARLVPNLAQWVRVVCRRALSVGADGVLIVSRIAADRIAVRYVNADGSDAFCGNGSRCAARYAWRRGWCGPRAVLETDAGEVEAAISSGEVRLRLPAPEDLGVLHFDYGGSNRAGRWIRAGVPHITMRVDDVSVEPLEDYGPILRRDPRLGSEGANVDVWAGRPDGVLELRTWERGVEGETLACGSGAVAVALASRREGGAERQVLIPRSRVPLVVELPGSAEAPGAAYLTGDARFVFEGTLDDEALTGPER